MDEIKIDLSGLVIDDLVFFDKLRTSDYSQAEIVDFLDRVVVGGARALPLTRLKDIMQSLRDELARIANPTDGQGKA